MSNLSQFIASSGSATTTVFTSSGSFTAPKTGTYLFMLQGAGGGGAPQRFTWDHRLLVPVHRVVEQESFYRL